MQQWARNNGASLEILPFDPTGKWADGNDFIQVPEELNKYLTSDYKVEEGKIVPPSTDYLRNQVAKEIANARFLIETAGITINDKHVSTTRESQALVATTYANLTNGLITSTNWKFSDGTYQTVTADSFKPIAAAVAQHTEKYRQLETTKVAELATLTVEQLLAYPVQQGFVPEVATSAA